MSRTGFTGAYVGLLAWATALTAVVYRRQPSDWFIFESFGRAVLNRGPVTAVGQGWAALHVYALMPRFQVGPPALLTAVPLQLLPPAVERALAVVLMMAVGLALVILAHRRAAAAGSPVTPARVFVVGCLFLVPWTAVAVKYLHWDDVLALAGLTLACWAVHDRRPWLAAALLGTAVAAKP